MHPGVHPVRRVLVLHAVSAPRGYPLSQTRAPLAGGTDLSETVSDAFKCPSERFHVLVVHLQG